MSEQASVYFGQYGSPNVLKVAREGLEVPEPSATEVRVRIEAASVCFTDTLLRRGMYPVRPLGYIWGKKTVSPGYDFCGIVDKVGSDVKNIKEGDKVIDLTIYGSYKRYIIRKSDSVVVVPRELDSAQVTSLVLSWMTAYQVLTRPKPLVQKGTKVLITGGNGAVGQALIVLTRHFGGIPYATAGEKYHEDLKSLGAKVLPRDAKDWLPLIEGEMDLSVDGICSDAFKSPMAALKKNGRFIALGISYPVAKKMSLLKLAFYFLKPYFRKNSGWYIITDYRESHPDHFREDIKELCQLLQEGIIKVNIEKTIGFEEVADAHRLLEQGGTKGKIILNPWL